MVSFSDPVAVPPTSAYGPPAVDFSWLANLPNQYFKAKQNQFQDQQNQNTTQQQQAFKDGNLPIDPQTGQIDYQKITQMLAQKGDINAISQLAPYVQFQQAGKNASQPDPMLANMPGGGQQPQSAPAPQPQPQKTPATQQGGDQAGSIVDVVTAKIPQEQAGPTIARIAQVTGIDPNAALTPGQQVRVNGLVQRYAQPAASPQSSPQGQPAPAAAPASQPTNARVDSGFSAFPPSAGNVSPAATPPQRPAPQRPAPQPGQQPQPAAQPRPQPPAPQVAPQARPPAPAPQQQQQPLVPQVPLPQGYSDPQQAILALNREAAMIARNKPDQAAMLQQWAKRIEASTQPVEVGPGKTLLNPATGQPIFQSAPSNPTAIAVQRFLAEKPDATPEEIQAFVQAGRGGRSAIAMYMNKYLQEHPDASADDVKRAAQLYTTQTTAQNRFLSGPQGNTIRSLNVVVSHIQTMQDLGSALNNGNVKAFNSIAQRWAEETGDPAPTNFDTAKQIVGAEVIKALGVAGAGSQAERQEAADAFNRARSPAQLAGAISAVRKLMVGQLSGLRRQFVAASGLPGDKFDEMLEPETKSFFGQSERGADSAAPAAKDNAGGNVVQWVRKPDGSLGPAQ